MLAWSQRRLISDGHVIMRLSTHTPGAINLSFKECFLYGGAILTAFGVCAGVMWNVFTYTGGKYDYLVEREDKLHQETRAYTEKMIEDRIATLSAQLDTHFGGHSTAINNTQAMIRDQGNLMIDQAQQTATHKAELQNFKDKLKEEADEQQMMEQKVDALEDVVVALIEKENAPPSSVEPAADRLTTQIRHALKPSR